MRTGTKQSGFILPVVVSTLLVVGIIVTGMLSYIGYATRVSGTYGTASQCRLSAQTALDQTKIQINSTFKRYYKNMNPSLWTVLSWFSSYSSSSIGLSGYTCSMMRDAQINGCAVSVVIQNVEPSGTSSVYQFSDVTLRATATGKTGNGISVSKTIEETVRFAMRRSTVFDHAYFVNNFGWFQGSGVTANGDIRANGNMNLDSYSYINGNAYAAPNDELGAAGYITVSGGGATRYMSTSTYWSSGGTWSRPTNPTSSDSADTWAMGYDGRSSLFSYQDTLEMPYLGDLDGYRELAANTGGTIKQNGTLLVDACYSGTGPSGTANGPDKGCLVLDGTSHPIEINGAVVVNGDVVIKGTLTGQGVIYSGRNIHIVGDITYKDAPAWSKPDTNPNTTIKQNATADMVGLCAKGNIVLGDYTVSSWLSSCRSYITTPFVDAYTCDATDASIGYGTVFNGNYTATDGGQQVKYTTVTTGSGKNKKTTLVASGTESRTYYESSVGNALINSLAQSTAITEIDAVLYNNHAVMGTVGQCLFNGAMVCRNEAIIYNSSVRFNWDSRLGSRSPDGADFFIYLPMSISAPNVVSWREIVL